MPRHKVINTLYLCIDRNIVLFLMIFTDNSESGGKEENKIVLSLDRTSYLHIDLSCMCFFYS